MADISARRRWPPASVRHNTLPCVRQDTDAVLRRTEHRHMNINASVIDDGRAGGSAGHRRPSCPCCGGRLRRIPRHVLDRLLCLFAPRYRYHCTSHTCRWTGLLRPRRL